MEALARARPRRPLVRASAIAFAALVAWSWLSQGFLAGEIFSSRRAESLRRFSSELVPFPLRGEGFSLGGWWNWAATLWLERGATAASSTLSISIVAIVLATALAAVLTLPATRTLSTAAPYLPSSRPASRAMNAFWWAVVAVTRFGLAFLRAVPEYLWVFLLIGVFGPTAWPAILALALHNAGILGRLGSEVIEDLDDRALAALRGVGARRFEIAVWGIGPIALPRLLLFFFYRWETCVREATVLGLLGIVSIGFWIQDARARQQADTMLFFILIGALLVIIGDQVSAAARRWVRDAR